MDPFRERLLARAATIDELLSDAFAQRPSEAAQSELSARRLAAWCQSSASGDWSLFARRLMRDGLTLVDVLGRFASARPGAAVDPPTWVDDAVWIHDAVCDSTNPPAAASPGAEPCAFGDLLTPVVHVAETLLWGDVDIGIVGEAARACLRRALLVELSGLVAPAIYERFAAMRKTNERSTGVYEQFIADMRTDGCRRLFDEKPILLRLMASLTRQWIESSREMLTRLAADLPTIRRELIGIDTHSVVISIESDLSDPHNFGRTVAIVGFADASRVAYKPKDLRVDAAWHALIDRLNPSAPMELRAARVLARDGYGWTEFIDNAGCEDSQGVRRSFRRAGAWLALFHCFVGVDMHQENILAAGEHPVPIDLEMILQASDAREAIGAADDVTGQAFLAAMETVNDSVMTVGLLPAYGKQPTSKAFSIGGITSNSAPRTKIAWTGIGSDAMRPVRADDTVTTMSNLPHVDGTHARLADHVDDFMVGFDEYATFLQHQRPDVVFEGFAGLTVRRVIRPTRFYYMLIQRLRDHRNMGDGIAWSAQADFTARFADWERDADPLWPLLRAERAAVVDLNVPHFVMASDGAEIRDDTGTSISVPVRSGLDRAAARLSGLDAREIAWQEEVIRQNTATLTTRQTSVPGTDVNRLPPLDPPRDPDEDPRDVLLAEADAMARTLSEQAFRQGPSVAWIGLDWLGDSEVSQLVVLGPDLYNGACGIALFLAAHAAVTGAASSNDLALAALAPLRATLRGRNPARTVRSLGLGGGLGMGSIVYALAVIAELLDDKAMLADAHLAAELITDGVISADRQLDVLGGSAGAILGLLRLYRQSGSSDVLGRAADCGRHLMAQPRTGSPGHQSWAAPGFDSPLNGMSHGAAGYAYALASLAAVRGDDEMASAAGDCIALENRSFDGERSNWPDLRGGPGAVWHCKWCHGAPGIGMARAAMLRLGSRQALPESHVLADVERALVGAQRGWPAPTDTLCCGTLGSIEFLWEAGDVLHRDDLRDLAKRRMLSVVHAARSTGDYRWSNGTRPFNLGLFRGIAGVGYTALRRVDPSLPNVLIWQ